ncbi:glycine oxidase ThiO [Anabaena sp. FACHB-1237]|uniref:glycine oxidase ThiO n=1 Tax=Anabaena sp. FACHB-1237 TaxID=2692769 RepID=UPI001681381F|nr:glycine oxidase ThiO [Anabaena sp. FACHB-1237]MBD2138299.1 glycine oxidase ThiO [Anabaena sp. FACHB-1237]
MMSDILVIGGGVIGLACAIEMKLRGNNVTVVCRDVSRTFQNTASYAAAGMLAPEAENIADEAMLSLCRRSRDIYLNWTQKLEQLTGLNSGYWPCGILAPVYSKPGVKNRHALGQWLDQDTINQYQTGLGADVIGGWWYPEDGQVDNIALMKVLHSAVHCLGIKIQQGVEVEAICQQNNQVIALQTNQGLISADHYILATGAWSQELLPLPVTPRKGQMLSVRIPETSSQLPLKRVLYGENTYIVPRRNGSIIIGATSENVGFTPDNTPKGIETLVTSAIELYPNIANYPIEQFWWGFRPATPDELPILGNSHCENLTFATGHYRNGILLAPITAKLIADLICEQKADSLLDKFHYSRFQSSSSTTKPMLTYFPSISENVPKPNQSILQDSNLVIAGKTFTSRLMTGTGKYRNISEMQQSVLASGCEIVTVAVRRVQTNAPGHEGLAEALDWGKIWMLPNTAGCQTAEEAIRVARLGREMAKLLGQEDNNFIKLEVIPDLKYLLPDPIGTLQAAEQLVKEGFAVLPYINADPMLAKVLEEVGCATVMPLAAPIGSGQGLKNTANIQIIIENAKIPVVVDAGIGAPSEAAQAMEMGADALLINSAIALAENAPAMAYAMNMATIAGRLAYLAGRMPMKDYASASSPLTGTIGK